MYRLSEEEFQVLRAKMGGAPPPVPAKRHKYNAHKVVIDGITFASKWEGRCYCDLKWQFQAGLITFPLLQVPFSLGCHYRRESFYIADFVYVHLATGRLCVVDAKGVATPLYKRKKRTLEFIYGMTICELRR
jgi:Protein of unknown function (DUF1064)